MTVDDWLFLLGSVKMMKGYQCKAIKTFFIDTTSQQNLGCIYCMGALPQGKFMQLGAREHGDHARLIWHVQMAPVTTEHIA